MPKLGEKNREETKVKMKAAWAERRQLIRLGRAARDLREVMLERMPEEQKGAHHG